MTTRELGPELVVVANRLPVRSIEVDEFAIKSGLVKGVVAGNNRSDLLFDILNRLESSLSKVALWVPVAKL